MLKYITSLLVALTVFSGAIGTAVAYDADNAFTCTIQWVVPSDTTFTVSFAGAETSVDFDDNITSGTVNLAEPDSQVASTSTPIIVVSNDGNVAQNITCNLTAAKPSWAILRVGDTNLAVDSDVFDTTAVQFATNIAAAANSDMYIWTNISSAAGGTTQRTLQINSAEYT